MLVGKRICDAVHPSLEKMIKKYKTNYNYNFFLHDALDISTLSSLHHASLSFLLPCYIKKKKLLWVGNLASVENL